jgi:hypothetical protein
MFKVNTAINFNDIFMVFVHLQNAALRKSILKASS